MAKVELLTLSSLFGLFSPQGVYLLAYAWLFGMCAFSNHPFVDYSSLTSFSAVDNLLRRISQAPHLM
jgi:hypothetical protein